MNGVVKIKALLDLLKAKSLKSIAGKAKAVLRLPWTGFHLYIVASQDDISFDSSGFPVGMNPRSERALKRALRFLSTLEFRELTLIDEAELEELSRVDPWRMMKSANIEQLQDGWRCFVVKCQDRIIASLWAKTGTEFYDPFMLRSFTLASNEVYGWREFCIPEFRGRGVAPWLVTRAMSRIAETTCIRRYIGFVRMKNKCQLNSLSGIGWSAIGRVGFVEIFGFRLNYLWGHNAFRLMKKRIFISRHR